MQGRETGASREIGTWLAQGAIRKTGEIESTRKIREVKKVLRTREIQAILTYQWNLALGDNRSWHGISISRLGFLLRLPYVRYTPHVVSRSSGDPQEDPNDWLAQFAPFLGLTIARNAH